MPGGRIKSNHQKSYAVLLGHLRSARIDSNITQVQLAKALGVDQSHISKIERGERRLDIVELREFCRALGISLGDFIKEFERLLDRSGV